jgi:hypothetical protein
MAIPAQFKSVNESDFTEKFVFPLLHRLGFSVVVNYHGAREFGKDIIFGYVDAFGHVRYDAIQVKFVPLIGLNEVQGVVDDCIQAFTNPFRHPQTGTEECISSFYALNGGSISDQARDHYFNSLRPRYGANARLVDGNALLRLDQSAGMTSIQNVLPRLNGLLLEIEHNRRVATHLSSTFQKYIASYGLGTNITKPNPIPSNRFRLSAVELYLQQPFSTEVLSVNEVEAYWDRAHICNTLFGIANGLTTVNMVDGAIQFFLDHSSPMENSAAHLSGQIRGLLKSLAPLAGL